MMTFLLFGSISCKPLLLILYALFVGAHILSPYLLYIMIIANPSRLMARTVVSGYGAHNVSGSDTMAIKGSVYFSRIARDPGV